MKVLIFVVCYNTPTFVEYQYRLFQKYLKTPFEYIVYDNTYTDYCITEDNEKHRAKLKTICDSFGIECRQVPKRIYGTPFQGGLYYPDYDVSTRVGRSITYAFQDILLHRGYAGHILLLDNDMFLIQDLDLEHWSSYTIAGIQQSRTSSQGEVIRYFTNQLFFVDTNHISDHKKLDFTPATIYQEDVDCGGKLHYLLEAQPNMPVHSIRNVVADGEYLKLFKDNPLHKDVIHYLEKEKCIIEETHTCDHYYHGEVYDEIFLHFRAGTNWRDGMKHNARIKELYTFLDLRVTNTINT